VGQYEKKRKGHGVLPPPKHAEPTRSAPTTDALHTVRVACQRGRVEAAVSSWGRALGERVVTECADGLTTGPLLVNCPRACSDGLPKVPNALLFSMATRDGKEQDEESEETREGRGRGG